MGMQDSSSGGASSARLAYVLPRGRHCAHVLIIIGCMRGCLIIVTAAAVAVAAAWLRLVPVFVCALPLLPLGPLLVVVPGPAWREVRQRGGQRSCPSIQQVIHGCLQESHVGGDDNPTPSRTPSRRHPWYPAGDAAVCVRQQRQAGQAAEC
jgi:hypothetical protein